MTVRSYYKRIVFTFFISTQSFTCEYIDDQYERRRGKHNDRLAETSFAEHTENINKLLSNYDKVSSVPATFNQKKSIIKTTMTKFFVHANPEQYKLSFKMPKETDKNYRHFKILEQTEVLSGKLAKRLIDNAGVKTIDRDFLSNQWNDHKELDEFGQITQEMYALWFNEALADHNKGLSKPIVSAFAEVTPTSSQHFTPNLSVIIDRKQKNVDVDLQCFSPIAHEKIFIGRELLSDSDTKSASSSATTLPERLSDTTPDHVDTTPNSSGIMLSEDELLKIGDHTTADGDEEDELASVATDYNTDCDELDDFLCIIPAKEGVNNTADKEQDGEWDDLTDDKSPDKKADRKDTESYTKLITGMLPTFYFWS